MKDDYPSSILHRARQAEDYIIFRMEQRELVHLEGTDETGRLLVGKTVAVEEEGKWLSVTAGNRYIAAERDLHIPEEISYPTREEVSLILFSLKRG